MSTATLIDVLTRHQIYLEGVKAYQAKQFNDVLLELQSELRKQFARLRYNTLDEMTKYKLRSFILEVRESQWKVYNGYTTLLLRMLREFMEADLDVSTGMFEAVSGKRLQEAADEEDNAPLIALAAIKGDAGGNDKLWAYLVNSPIPANGILLVPFLAGFANSAVNAVENLIRKAYANRWTPDELLRQILGTKAANFRDGAFNGINNQAAAVAATVIQHASSIAQGSVASIFYREYRWVSVIDNKTSDICLSRDGKTYRYGKGPLPPAHIRCRSKTVPVGSRQDKDAPRSYMGWLKEQPIEVLADILGAARAEQVRAGKAKSSDYASFTDAKPLTIAQFKGKRQLMLTNG
jgi:SPP1 gp7 family putative phage head morphogenesis protein